MAGRGTSAKTAEQKVAPETAEKETAEKVAPETAEKETAEKVAPETAEKETAEKVAPETAEKETAEKVAPETAEKETAEPEPTPEGEVTVKVAVGISGLRNGEPWPAVGEPITLPADEAASYIQFGYVVPIED